MFSSEHLTAFMKGSAVSSIPCAHCGHIHKVKNELAGKQVRCSKCEHIFRVSPPPALVGSGVQTGAGHVTSTLQHLPDSTGAYDTNAATMPPRETGPENTLAVPAEMTSGMPAGETVVHEREACYAFLSPPQEPNERGGLGTYRILDVLGAGGMGVVFLAHDPQLKRTVALKAMLPGLASTPSNRERFLREAQAAAAIEHDHVVTILHVGEDGGVPFLVMPLLKGENLDTRLQRESKLPVPEVLRIGREIAEGLAIAHERGLMHRDIKPANIWLEGKRRRVKILDFGLARSVGDTNLTLAGTIMGTPAYMAPEQAQGKPLDQRSDLFSLGCVLYRMVTGEPPFKGPDTISTLMAVVSHQPTPPRVLLPELPPALSDLILQLLAKEPGDRLPSAEVVIETLASLEEQQDKTEVLRRADLAAPVTRTESLLPLELPAVAPQRQRRRTWMTVALTLGLLALGGLLLGMTVFKVKTPKGTIVVEVDQAGAEVSVDGQQITIASPTEKEPVKVEVGAGAHELKITKGGFVTTTRQFSLKSGETEVVRVKLEPAQGAGENPARGDERAVAEWVLKRGGAVVIVPSRGAEPVTVREAANLPRTPFRLKLVTIHDAKEFADRDLERFKGLSGLEEIGIISPLITDAGLEHLASLTGLQALSLPGSKILGPGLAHLKTLKKLRNLSFNECQSLTDDGLEQLAGLTGLQSLDLTSTKVTDEGLKHLKGMTDLDTLGLSHTSVSDAGLVHLKGLKTLRNVNLGYTQVNGSGLGVLKEWPSITSITFSKTPLTDAGLEHFKGLSKQLYGIQLDGTKISDAGLKYLVGQKSVGGLNLSDTVVTDAGLESLKGMVKMEVLNLAGTKVTDAGLERLKGMQGVGILNLANTAVTDAGLEHLKGLMNLHNLDLTGAKVTDQGVQGLKAALPATKVSR